MKKCCWICGDTTTNLSKEHLVKQTDLSQLFERKVNQRNPVFLHHEGGKSNLPIGSIKKSHHLKSNAPMCARCNNSTTQQHDESWKIFSSYLTKAKGRQPHRVKVNKIFARTKGNVKGVQLYFAKNLGCRIVASNAPIDIQPLSRAILSNELCPFLFLSFGFVNTSEKSAGATKISHLKYENGIEFANYIYWVGSIAVEVMYSTIVPKSVHVSFNPQKPSKILPIVIRQ